VTLLQLPSAALLFAASWHLTCSIRLAFQKPQGFSKSRKVFPPGLPKQDGRRKPKDAGKSVEKKVEYGPADRFPQSHLKEESNASVNAR